MARRRRRLAARVGDCARSLLAFLFSNVGVIVLVVAYAIAGAFMFQAIEGAGEMERENLMARKRDNTTLYLWQNVTLRLNPLNETALKDSISLVLRFYQREIVKAVRRGWDGGRSSRQWSFSSAFLYSLTVITTIGYGHLSPRTSWGKVTTIFYALLGMPLFLLYLANIGELLARWFKCLYALVCLCRGCPGFTRRRVARLRTQLEISDPESIERPEGWRSRHSDSDVTPDHRSPRHTHSTEHRQNHRDVADRIIPNYRYPMDYRSMDIHCPNYRGPPNNTYPSDRYYVDRYGANRYSQDRHILDRFPLDRYKMFDGHNVNYTLDHQVLNRHTLDRHTLDRHTLDNRHLDKHKLDRQPVANRSFNRQRLDRHQLDSYPLDRYKLDRRPLDRHTFDRHTLDRYPPRHPLNIPPVNRQHQDRHLRDRHQVDSYPLRHTFDKHTLDRYPSRRPLNLSPVNRYQQDRYVVNRHPVDRYPLDRHTLDNYQLDRYKVERLPRHRNLPQRCEPDLLYSPQPNRDFQRRPDYFRSTSMPQPWASPHRADPHLRGWSEPLGYRTEESQGSSEFSYVTFDAQTITVPLSVCVFILVGYLLFGSMLFGMWEKWDQLDGAYFCFISLSSIGFGDFVPGERVYTPRIQTSFIVCSMYLMLGMALVAMCFNLMQEQVIHYVAGMKRAVKRICRCKR